ncbi:MAG: alanine racemase [Candidatus Omnitrophica bacterium]|nr:alanine racemase [Candidatus Omnitrophota bacterium]
MVNGTWVEVDLDAIRANARALKELVGTRVQLAAVVKANAYGHGMLQVAEALSSPRWVDWFAVASLTEAIQLRNHGITIPVLILGEISPEDAPLIVQHQLAVTVSRPEVVQALAAKTRPSDDPIRLHVKVDTGMGRYGVEYEKALDFIRWVRKFPGLMMEGLWTHLSSADDNERLTRAQLTLYAKLVVQCEQNRIFIPLKHVANSMGLMAYPAARYDLVRAGLSLYGICPKEKFKAPVRLTPALSWKARVALVKSVSAGQPISYGATYRTKKLTRIATLPVGYAHGFPWHSSNRGRVMIRGKMAPVVGRITMDHVMVDVTRIPGVRPGDVAALIGSEGKAVLTAHAQARAAGTIPYEIVSRISHSVPRQYNSRASAGAPVKSFRMIK